MEKLLRKYYGYVADLEGSGVEAFDLLFVRDRLQKILDHSTPETAIPERLYNQIHELDEALWRDRAVFLQVLGEEELRHARLKRRSPPSHWWWYLDQIRASVGREEEPGQHLAVAFGTQ